MAIGDRLDHAEAVLGDGIGEEFVQLEGVVNGRAGDIGGTGGDGELADREGRLDIAIGGSGRLAAERRGGAVLPAGHAVNGIVDHQGGDAQVAAGGMNEMVATDCQGISIAHDGDHLQVRAGDLEPGGKRQGAAMGGVQGVEIQINGHAGGAADAGDQGHIVIFQTQVVDGADEGAHDHADAAAGTPDGGEFLVLAQFLEGFAAFEPVGLRNQGLVLFQGVGFEDMFIHGYASIASRTIWGVTISPLARTTRLTFLRPTMRSTS